MQEASSGRKGNRQSMSHFFLFSKRHRRGAISCQTCLPMQPQCLTAGKPPQSLTVSFVSASVPLGPHSSQLGQIQLSDIFCGCVEPEKQCKDVISVLEPVLSTLPEADCVTAQPCERHKAGCVPDMSTDWENSLRAFWGRRIWRFCWMRGWP